MKHWQRPYLAFAEFVAAPTKILAITPMPVTAGGWMKRKHYAHIAQIWLQRENTPSKMIQRQYTVSMTMEMDLNKTYSSQTKEDIK